MTSMKYPAVILLAISFSVYSQLAISVRSELCTSVENLFKLALIKTEILGMIEKNIQAHQEKLNKLYLLQEDVKNKLDHLHQMANHANVSDDNIRLGEHPVWAFISTNRLIKALESIKLSLDTGNELMAHDDKNANYVSGLEFESVKASLNLPSIEDLIGCGEALLRLKAFYGLEVDDMVGGKLIDDKKVREKKNGPENTGTIMSSIDCFELGKIAYDNEDYLESIRWFKKAIDLSEGSKSFEDESLLETLDYMAFAAYKSNQISYAAELTRVWLKKEPNNERARTNLEYYLEDIATETNDSVLSKTDPEAFHEKSKPEEKMRDSTRNIYAKGIRFSPANYVIEEDEVVRNLCRGNDVRESQNVCSRIAPWHKGLMFPWSKFELLHTNPDIVRIYDVITKSEAEHLRKLAAPNLERSTVKTQLGLVTTDFRMARTAWLSKLKDSIVHRIEHRLSAMLNIDLNDSEDLQIVNYGVGGFYGPHLDSARDTSSSSNLDTSLMNNDRLATILLYLNAVNVGGATVFPRLNLSVDAVENSALVWFNLLDNGFSDERTLHTGCPVLLGSKWIATKWPREQANTFRRPCNLKEH